MITANNVTRWLAATAVITALGSPAAMAGEPEEAIEEITVWGQDRLIHRSHYPSPSSLLTPEDFDSINAVTIEDLVKYEPSLVVRRRFIGDPNGTLGMRGSNMFQTTRTMVFADGIPLHYFLQTRWNGSPRWSLVSPDEIGEIEVIYGPFSAELSGNAMGGVVKIETIVPTERRIHVQAGLFQQNFSDVGFANGLNGSRLFSSYGDRFGQFSVYASYNHLHNQSQPMAFLFDGYRQPAGGEQAVAGAIHGVNEYSDPVANFADAGSADVTTDQLKLKLGYDFGEWSVLLNAAYEDRSAAENQLNNYLRSPDGAPVWSGEFVQDGIAFSVDNDDFAVGASDRKSLLLGGRIKGAVAEHWWLEFSASRFEILRDETRDSDVNPADPAYTPAGSVRIYDDTGWDTAELKVQTDRLFGSDRLNLVGGYSREHYRLRIENYDSDDYAAGVRSTPTGFSGGETDMQAFYLQSAWQFVEDWDVTLGGRYESWSSNNGFYYDLRRNNIQDHDDRQESRFSPKLSLGIDPENAWSYRYSLARAYRFPIVEELFQNERRTIGTSLANANLEPEGGLHHNLMLQRQIENGHLRVNLFTENIRDVIFAQTAIVDNRVLNTFIPIDRVETSGAEFIFNQAQVMDSPIDLRFNASYVDAKIAENGANPSLEGKTFPRMPKLRAHLLLTYRVNDQWDVGGGIRYAGDSYGDLDNADSASNVFGAHDGYTLLNFRSNYRINDTIRLSLGIDNLTNEIAYVHHPWPGRTAFLEASMDF